MKKKLINKMQALIFKNKKYVRVSSIIVKMNYIRIKLFNQNG